MVQNRTKKTEVPTAETTFYLVLHGEIAIYDGEGESISIFTPPMPEHVYMAGPWLGEERIPEGLTLQLTGVNEMIGTDLLRNYPDQFVIFQGGRLNPAGSYLEIRAPRPVKIHPCGLTPLFDYSITLDGPPGVSLLLPKGSTFPPFIAECCVLEYQISEGVKQPPALELVTGPDPTVQATWIGGQNSLTRGFSMHIYTESDATEKEEHAAASFHSAAAILGASAQMDPTQRTVGPDNPRLDFLAPEEISYTLPARIRELRGLTAEQPQNGKFRTLKRFTLPTPKAAFFNDMFTCGHVGMVP
jgi:hypothetical protein